MMELKIESVNHVSKKYRSLNLLRLTLALVLLSVIPQSVEAVTVGWDTTTDSTIQGYRLYRAEGTCFIHGNFSLSNSYGLVTGGVVTNPATSGTYCHFVTAYNTAGESPASTMIEYTYTIQTQPQCPSVKYCRSLHGDARRKCLACK